MENTPGPTAAGLTLPSPSSYSLTLKSWRLLGIHDRQPQEVGRSSTWRLSHPYTAQRVLLGPLDLDKTLFPVAPGLLPLLPLMHQCLQLRLGPCCSFFLECPSHSFICLLITRSGFWAQLKYSLLPGKLLWAPRFVQGSPMEILHPYPCPYAIEIVLYLLTRGGHQLVISYLFHQTRRPSRARLRDPVINDLVLAWPWQLPTDLWN